MWMYCVCSSYTPHQRFQHGVCIFQLTFQFHWSSKWWTDKIPLWVMLPWLLVTTHWLECFPFHLPLEHFLWHFSISFMLTLIYITLLFLAQLKFPSYNCFTRAELQKPHSPAMGMMVMLVSSIMGMMIVLTSSTITAGSRAGPVLWH